MTRFTLAFILALGGFVVGTALGARHASAQELPLGVVAEKPADGRFVKIDEGYMVPYQTTIPGTEISFDMVPIPGGEFVMGSPEDEDERRDDEGPQFKVRVEPFWMGQFEVTWQEYKRYMDLHDIFKEFQSQGIRQVTEQRKIDAITAPSSLYDPSFTFDAGDDPRQPAATMTQYAAKQYTKWLSIITGQFYRLPSEAEWEYACRAGTKTAYSFGDDPEQLEEYAWYDDNSDYERHEVGQKKPNPWGLYDMHGNVSEWVLDAYDENGYPHGETDNVLAADEALQWPTAAYPLVVRGGSWELYAEDCRSAARLATDDEEWKVEDPNIPKSPWWFTTEPSTGVGFRIMRPLNEPASRDGKEKFWRTNVKQIEKDVRFRIDSEGKGAEGIVDPQLPAAIEKLKQGKR